MPETLLITLGIILIMLGFILVALSIMRSAREAALDERGEEKVKGGGVILIGPVPIVFGTDKRYALLLMLLAIVLMLLAIVFLK